MRLARLSLLGWSLLGTALASGTGEATTPAAPALAAPRTDPSSLVAPHTRAPALPAPNPRTPPLPSPAAAVPAPAAAVPTPSATLSTLSPIPYVHAPLLGDPCLEANAPDPSPLTEQGGPKKLFSVNGYVGRALRVTRGSGALARTHCITVAWPPGKLNTAGKATRVARDIDAAWFRAIENTLARLPWTHVQVLRRFVIDDRPSLHGVAPFDRQSPDDARDGHTIWLHSHLFKDKNHWVRGNHGTYWGYHTNKDGTAFDGRPADHELFSPVLLHEIGHTVMYNLVNPAAEVARTPDCARTCGDLDQGCGELPPEARETGCISAYCMPFDFPGSTENWAELYRFHYQSSVTRALLARSRAQCGKVLAELDLDGAAPLEPPWQRGLPDMPRFQPTRWKSCGGRACKPW